MDEKRFPSPYFSANPAHCFVGRRHQRCRSLKLLFECPRPFPRPQESAPARRINQRAILRSLLEMPRKFFRQLCLLAVVAALLFTGLARAPQVSRAASRRGLGLSWPYSTWALTEDIRRSPEDFCAGTTSLTTTTIRAKSCRRATRRRTRTSRATAAPTVTARSSPDSSRSPRPKRR